VLPQHRLGRVLIALTVGVFVVFGAIEAAARLPQPEDNLPLAPALDTPQPTLVSETVGSVVLGTPVSLDQTPSATQVPVATQVSVATRVPAPTATPIGTDETEFERVLHPLLVQAKRQRAANAAKDPTYWHRLDPRLNATRLNFLLFGYGETHEPPLTERAFIGSFTIFSYDYATRQIDLISMTHDIRAPEAERYLHDKGQAQVGPIKLDRIYSMGGFDLMRRTLEDASGLAIDYQLAFREAAIQAATDDVFGGLDVDVPMDFEVNAYYLDGVKYPGGEFQKGVQHLDGTQVIQFIKTVPVEQNYDPALEHNARKHLIFRSLMASMQQHSGDIGFLGRAALFFSSQVSQDSIAYDFDLRSLVVDNLRTMMLDWGRSDPSDSAMPSVDRTMYVVDPASGDGGVQWIVANAATNPITKNDLDQHVYSETAMEVPYHGDPYAPDLATGYWSDVRNLIASRLVDN
jgi:hypothetical protein